MPDVRALLFDLDGTLVDTYRANYFAYRDALTTYGRALSAEAFAETWGRDSRDFLPDLYPELTAEEVEGVRSAKAACYEEHLAQSVANEDLLGLARSVRGRLRLALVTTAKRPNVRATLARHELEDLFEVVVTGDDVTRSKPHPDGYRLALHHLGVPAAEGLAFEDSDSGVQAARAAGLGVVRVAFPV